MELICYRRRAKELLGCNLKVGLEKYLMRTYIKDNLDPYKPRIYNV
jgi:hypothetical protein